jgi:biofilm PGA synthesis N-glycosyltransferase PgaC
MKKILVIVPAHNEERNLPACIEGLKKQTVPTSICVVSDNSTDRTIEIAQSLNVDFVLETRGNTGLRAGAINHGIDECLPSGDYDYVLAMDADSVPALDMIEEGIKELEKNPKLAMVCSRAGVQKQKFHGIIDRFLWHCQHIEYSGFDALRVETTDSIMSAHGLSTIYRTAFFVDQMQHKGRIYNEMAIIEDYDLTLDAKELDWKATSCQKMKAWTIVPLTLKGFINQRIRWSYGGIESLAIHGINNITKWDAFAHVSGIVMQMLQIVLLATIVILVLSGIPITFAGFFFVLIAVTILNQAYRLKYCQNINMWDVLIVLTIVPQMVYGYILTYATYVGYKRYITHNGREWTEKTT